MPSIRSLLTLGLVGLTYAAEFQDLIAEVPVESLKAALEQHPRYRDGVFEDQRDAIQAVHQDDPALATRLVDIAKQDVVEKEELRRRQTGNTTVLSTTVQVSTTAVVVTDPSTTTTSLTTSSSTVVISQGTTTPAAGSSDTTPAAATTPKSSAAATQSGVLVPVVVSSTANGGSVVAVTTSAFVTSASESLSVAVTTTNAQGSTFVTSTVVPAAVVTSTNADGSAVVTTSPLAAVQVGSGGSIITSAPALGASATPKVVSTTDEFGSPVVWSGVSDGAVLTATDGGGRTVVTTITPGGGQVSELVLQTTQLPDGSRSTITSYTVVGGGDATTTDSSGPAETSSEGTHGLQSGMAAPTRRFAGEVAAIVGGAIGIAAFL